MTDLTLSDLGWSDHFARQLEDGDAPARIAEIHRTILVALTPEGPVKIGAPSVRWKRSTPPYVDAVLSMPDGVPW